MKGNGRGTNWERPLHKRLGQHLLKDQGVLRRIVEAAGLVPQDRVLEIGAGTGRLTGLLARAAGRVVAVELDERFRPELEALAATNPGLTVLMQDVMRLNLAPIWSLPPLAAPAEVEPASPVRRVSGWKVVSNLPYYLSTPILTRLLEQEYAHLDSLVLLLQEEVARRLAARPGTADYGAISLLVRYRTQPEVLFKVSPTAFVPPPKVSSAVVRFKLLEVPPVEVPPALIFPLVKAAFGQRRKTLLNALSALPWPWGRRELALRLEQAGVEPARRGETLSLEEFARLAQVLGPAGAFPAKQR